MTAPTLEDCVRQCFKSYVGEPPDDTDVRAFPVTPLTFNVRIFVRGACVFSVQGEDPETVLDVLENRAASVGEAMRAAVKLRKGVA